MENILISGYGDYLMSLTHQQSVQVKNATYACVSQDGYASVFQDHQGCGIVYFDKQLQEQARIYTDEKNVSCHIMAVDDLIVSCNYHNGCVYFFKNKQYIDQFKISDEKSHPHCCVAGNGYLYLFFLGLDKIVVINQTSFQIIDEIVFEKGTGIRHGLFVDDILYAVSEHSGEVFKIVNHQIVKKVAMPGKSGSAIRLYQDMIVAGNRELNQVSLFQKEDLELFKNISTYGDHPRDYDVWHDQLIVANRFSNQVCFISLLTGELLSAIDFNQPSVVVIDNHV